jgi:hypothetical protein
MTLTDKNEVIGKIILPQQVTKQMVHDLLITALDGDYGGSNYWITQWWAGPKEKVKYLLDEGIIEWTPEAITENCVLNFKVEDYDDDPNEIHILTLEDYIVGLGLACKNFGQSLECFYENHDAIGADVALQFSLFEEIVYG